MSEIQNAAGTTKKKRLRIHEVTRENDMGYRGPLTFQHFQIIGWLCLVLTQVVVMMKLGGRINADIARNTAGWQNILSNVAELSLPFLLIANFAQILDVSKGYKAQIIKNILAAAGLSAVFYLVFYRYLLGTVEAVLVDPNQARPFLDLALLFVAPHGFFAFNLFIDLLLCSLTMLFLNYRPRHVFTGKSVILFRLLALLPIAYEIGCMVLKYRAAKGLVEIPLWAYPLLPVKPPMTFVLFVALAIFVKTREMRFRRHGKTHEEYLAFLKTNRNSWNFSVFLAIMLAVVSLLDFGMVMGLSVSSAAERIAQRIEQTVPADASATPAPEEAILMNQILASETASPEATLSPEEQAAQDEAMERDDVNAAITRGIDLARAIGFGDSIILILLAPIVLLFSYTRRPKNEWVGLLIPVAGIALIVLVYLEGFHQILHQLPIQKLDLEDFEKQMELYSSMMQ